jgi:transposase
MRIPQTPIQLSRDERDRLQSWVRSTTIPNGLALRAQIILLAAEGRNNSNIAVQCGVSRQTVVKWRSRFAKERIQGLRDVPRSGKPAVYTAKDRRRVLLAIGRKPKNATHWSVRRLAEATGISRGTVHRILKAERLKPHLTKSWVHSSDPEFEAKALDIIGLYLDPPENVLVLSVDEKTCIQALDRTEPILPLKPGLAERRSFDYVRHGTTNLYAALAVHHGQVTGLCTERHRHEEFLAFIKLLWRKYKEQELHLIVDNLSAHKHQKVKDWFRKHPRVVLHFTPTHSSWLNQIEIWFSILARKAILRGTFRSTRQLVKVIMDFIESYNERGQTFNWTCDKNTLIRKLNNVTEH